MQISNLQIFKYFLYLGVAGFGGPLAIIEHMRRDLVDEMKWMTPAEFKSYFGFSQICPGPLAFQFALYFSYFKKGLWAAVLAGIGLVLPSFIFVLLFSVFYKEFRDINYVTWALYGISPVIIAIIFYSGFKLSRNVFHNDVFQYVLFFSAIAVSIFFKLHILLLIALFAVIALIYYVGEREFINNKVNSFSLILVSGVILALKDFTGVILNFFGQINSKLLDIAYVFIKAGALTYGSGFVIIGVLREDVVENFHWLTSKEFLDGIAFGQITPGPVVITSTFIGYMVSGFWGSLIATVSVFLPSFVLVMIVAQIIDKIKDNFYLQSALKGANAAAIGAIITIAYYLSDDAIFDYWTLGLFFLTGLILFTTKVRPYYLIALGAVAGMAIKFFT
ncbi:MAG: chromate efflux transporter [Candidatus Kapaibacterium sp.]